MVSFKGKNHGFDKVDFNRYEYIQHCLKRLTVEIGPRPAGYLANRSALVT